MTSHHDIMHLIMGERHGAERDDVLEALCKAFMVAYDDEVDEKEHEQDHAVLDDSEAHKYYRDQYDRGGDDGARSHVLAITKAARGLRARAAIRPETCFRRRTRGRRRTRMSRAGALRSAPARVSHTEGRAFPSAVGAGRSPTDEHRRRS